METQALAIDMQTLVTAQIEEVKNYLTEDRVADSIQDLDSVGLEVEFGTVNSKGQPIAVAEQLAKSADIVTEFSNSSGEIVSDPFSIDGQLFSCLYDFLNSRLQKIERVLRSIDPDARMLRMGLLPTRNPADYLYPENVVSNAKPRYQNFVDFLGERYGTFETVLPTPKGEIKIFQAPPTIAGDTYGTHFNISVKHKYIGLVHDLGIAFSWLFAYLSSSSAVAFHQVGAWNSRPFVWGGGMSKDKELTPFGPGGYLGNDGNAAILKWLDYLSTRIDILSFEDCGADPSSPLSAIKLRTGTCWLSAGRIRLGVTADQKLSSYYEFRVPDTALSTEDTIADLALFVGLMSYYLGEIDSVSELISYEDAERAYWDVSQNGNVGISWEGKEQSCKNVASQMILNAYEGLLKFGVCEREARELTNNLSRRLACPHVLKHRNMISRLMDDSYSEAEAVEVLVQDILEKQEN